jgi:hypothetical protein
MKVCDSKPRKTIAAVIDFYYLAMAVGFVASLVVSVTRVNVIAPLHTMLFLLLDLAIVVVYHTVVSPKAPLLTLGEVIAGRIRENGNKRWTNPYCRNRSGIVAYMFTSLILYGNSFDAVFAGTVPSTTGTIFTGLRITLVSLGFILIGKGRIGGVFIPAALMLFGPLLSMVQRSGSRLASITMTVNMILGLAGIVIWLVYRRSGNKTTKESTNTEDGE